MKNIYSIYKYYFLHFNANKTKLFKINKLEFKIFQNHKTGIDLKEAQKIKEEQTQSIIFNIQISY